MSEKKKIAIIGEDGYVGRAYYKYFKGPDFSNPHCDIIPVDINFCNVDRRWKDLNKGVDLVVICVPTPSMDSGQCDIRIVTEVVARITLNNVPILIKSAVPPGTTDYLNHFFDREEIVVSPEYIGEGGYEVPWWDGVPHPTEVIKHNFQIFGGEREYTLKVIDIFESISGPHCRYYQTDANTAELVKYMENAYLATKVTFCNEFYDIAEVMGVDYHELRELWLLDGRVNRSHTSVYPDKRGFGGKCLPKDLAGLIYASAKKNYDPPLLKKIERINKARENN